MNEHLYLTSSEVVQQAPAGVEGKTEAISRVIIGERVRLARMAANLTQQELAGTIYSKSYISAVERGKMTPSFQALHILAERLNRPLSYFLGEGEADLGALAGSGAALGLSDEERQKREREARQMLKDSEEWMVKGNPGEALATLQVAVNEPPAALPLAERPRWYWLAGWAGVRERKFAEAISWLERGLEVTEAARAQAPFPQKARLAEMAERIRELLGGCYYDLSQPARALDYHLRCLAAITDGTVTDSELKLLIYKALGNDNLTLGRHDESITFYKRACDLAEDMNDPRQRGLAYWGLGLAYKSSGDFFRAETAFREALNAFERQDDMHLASQLHAVMGQMLTDRKDYQRAERHLHLALENAERLGDNRARGVALGNLAIFHLRQGNSDEAIKAAQEGLSELKHSKDYRSEGQLYLTLAQAYETSPDISAAEQAYKDAVATFMQAQDSQLISRAHDLYGQFLAAQGRFEEAYEQMGKAQ